LAATPVYPMLTLSPMIRQLGSVVDAGFATPGLQHLDAPGREHPNEVGDHSCLQHCAAVGQAVVVLPHCSLVVDARTPRVSSNDHLIIFRTHLVIYIGII
jgi:hypothetical protein